MSNVLKKPIHILCIMLCVAALPAALSCVMPAPLVPPAAPRVPPPQSAQETTAPALPPEAQQAFDRGLKAVQQQEWGLATRSFSDAQTTAPYASTVLFNLGVAHAKAGHELPAIAWLHASLAVTPHTPNAEAIRAEIERLKKVTREKMNTIFQTAIAAAQQLETRQPLHPRSDKERALDSISTSQAFVGDIDAALATSKLAGSQEKSSELSSTHWRWFAYGLTQDGDLERAREALKHVTEAKDQDDVWESIFHKMQGSGDLEAARTAAQNIQDAKKRGALLRTLRSAVLRKIVDQNAEKGEFDFAPVEELLPLLGYDSSRVYLLLSMAEWQGKFKDVKGKNQTINRALSLARSAQKTDDRASMLASVAETLLAMGDLSSAKTLARESLASGAPAWGDEFHEKELANIQVIHSNVAVMAHAILGNVSEALTLIRGIKSHAYAPDAKDNALAGLVYTQAMSGDLKGAKKTAAIAASIFDNLAKDDLDGDTGRVQVWLARAQLQKGDPIGAFETLKGSRVADRDFAGACGKIFDHLMAKGEVSKAMEVAKLIGEVARRKENVRDLEGAAKEYVRAMGRIQMHAAAGDKAGKSEAAQVTTHFVHAANWIALAIEVSTAERTGDLEKALKDAAEGKSWWAKTARERINNLAGVAETQGRTLNKIGVLERKNGQERGGK